MSCDKCCWTERPCECECHTRDREQTELRRLRAACESLAEQLEGVSDAGRGGNWPTFARQADEWARHLRTALKGEP